MAGRTRRNKPVGDPLPALGDLLSALSRCRSGVKSRARTRRGTRAASAGCGYGFSTRYQLVWKSRRTRLCPCHGMHGYLHDKALGTAALIVLVVSSVDRTQRLDRKRAAIEIRDQQAADSHCRTGSQDSVHCRLPAINPGHDRSRLDDQLCRPAASGFRRLLSRRACFWPLLPVRPLALAIAMPRHSIELVSRHRRRLGKRSGSDRLAHSQSDGPVQVSSRDRFSCGLCAACHPRDSSCPAANRNRSTRHRKGIPCRKFTMEARNARDGGSRHHSWGKRAASRYR